MIGVALLIGILTATAVAAIVRGLRAPLPSLDAHINLVLHDVPAARPWQQWRDRLTARTPPAALSDIALLGRDVGEVVITRLVWAAVAAVAVVVLAAGLGVGLVWLPVLGFAGAAGGWVVSLHEIRDTAAKRRRTLGLALAAWTQMAAMMIRAGMGIDQALHTAANTGNHWTFEMLATTLKRGDEQRQPVWQALATLGNDTDVAELRQLAAELRLTESVGGSPADALIARAQLLRDQELADQLAAAKRAEVKQAVPLSMLGMCLVVYMLWPAMQTFVNT